MIYIKQYGAKRSGTNYTRWLLENNFENIQVMSELLGWKHGPHSTKIDWTGKNWVDPSHSVADQHQTRLSLMRMVTDDLRIAAEKKQIRYLITVKNPYAWFISYTQRFTQRPEALGTIKETIELWNQLHKNWIALAKDNPLTIIVRYEDLIFDFHKTMVNIEHKLRLKKKDTELGRLFVDSTNKMARRSDANWHMGQTNQRFDASYYMEEKYMQEFDPALLKIFREILDKDVVRDLGYGIR